MQLHHYNWSAVAVLTGFGCRNAAPPPPSAGAVVPAAPPRWVVSADRIGTLQVGWSLSRFNAATGETLHPTYEISEECDILHPAGLPDGVSVMVIRDTVVRFDVGTAGILTRDGVGVGDSEQRVLEAYAGTIRVQPHKYTGPVGHYLIVTPPSDTLHRIIFETDGRKVLNYRAGSLPGVELVEGCA